MSRFAIRLLTLAMYATALVAVPMITPARAAADSSKQMKKHKKETHHRSPGIATARSPSANPFPPMDEDPDRKAGGGGGY